ncbi:hypothetical protein LBMAG12_02980 [Actinomycetes bacterium]|nr:hypothetical protein LBMAG12_02980 [Actinomycetes bacterium]
MTTTISEMPQRLVNLRRWNLALGFLHAVQALVILLMAGNFAITITSNFPVGPPGTRLEMPQSLFDLAVGPAVAVFLALAAIDHLLTATIKRATYETDLARGINRFRWVEYAFSATLMLILIGSYSGVTDITAIFAVIGANVGMILFGWLQETLNPIGRSQTTMWPFWCGALVGITPWIAIWFNVIGADTVPGFVYGIIVTEQIFFFSFGLNQWLQYRGIGKWNNYLYGEKVYLVLSLAAKSVLAWQIYGGSLAN